MVQSGSSKYRPNPCCSSAFKRIGKWLYTVYAQVSDFCALTSLFVCKFSILFEFLFSHKVDLHARRYSMKVYKTDYLLRKFIYTEFIVNSRELNYVTFFLYANQKFNCKRIAHIQIPKLRLYGDINTLLVYQDEMSFKRFTQWHSKGFAGGGEGLWWTLPMTTVMYTSLDSTGTRVAY